MDNQSMAWLPEPEMEEPGNNMKHQQRPPYYSDSIDSFSSEKFKGLPNMVTRNQSIHVATTNSDVNHQQDHKETRPSRLVPSYSSSANTFSISFRKPTSPQDLNYRDTLMISEEDTSLNEFLGSIDGTTRFQSTRRNHRQLQEHVLAERKRREKLAERFISLSALLPGHKKMDKASVLEDARRYILQLQTRVKVLEETSVKGKDIIKESGVSLGISKGGHEDIINASSSDNTNYLPPEIKARISGSKMLVRIYCIKSPSIVLKTLTEMERLHMTVDCCSVLPFGTAHLITIIAQMSDEIVITAKHLVKCLLSTLGDFH